MLNLNHNTSSTPSINHVNIISFLYAVLWCCTVFVLMYYNFQDAKSTVDRSTKNLVLRHKLWVLDLIVYQVILSKPYKWFDLKSIWRFNLIVSALIYSRAHAGPIHFKTSLIFNKRLHPQIENISLIYDWTRLSVSVIKLAIVLT